VALYFAYGSNLSFQQIRERCPSARFVCTARLDDFDLAFTRYSERRKSGVADIVEKKGEQVWGVVYQIDELDLGRLDKCEGYQVGRKRNAYRRIERMVFTGGDTIRPHTIFTYEVEEKKECQPSEEYKRLIIEGARYWHLPEEYISKLENLPVAQVIG
jgi:gamma-glutamylcyclotransferase (GGCT)/AIG2-like uncharacterized protein YtfP